MEPQPAENFFEIKVSPEGLQRISQMFKTVKWMFGFCIVLSVLFLTLTVLRSVLYSKLPETTTLDKVYMVIYPVYAILVSIGLIGQWGAFFYFTRMCKRSILAHDSERFNYSFKWLQRFAVYSVGLLIVECLMGMFAVGEVIYYLRQIPAS
jgi:hypothetical protein